MPVTHSPEGVKLFRLGVCQRGEDGSLVGPFAHPQGAPLVLFRCEHCAYTEVWEHSIQLDRIGLKASIYHPLSTPTAMRMGVHR